MTKPVNLLTVPEIKKGLESLGLPVFAARFEALNAAPEYQRLTFAERLGILLHDELVSQQKARTQRLLERSGLLKIKDNFADADITKAIFKPERNLDEATIKLLLSCDWIEKFRNVMVTGATGTGKSWLMVLLGKQACAKGYSVRYLKF